jgi:hypothetical protein
MLLCRVALGKIHEVTGTQSFAHAPPGCHSVKGRTNFNEYIVYRGEQVSNMINRFLFDRNILQIHRRVSKIE